MKTFHIYDISRNSSGKSCRENQIHVLCSITFFFFANIMRLWSNAEKYGTTRQATDRKLIGACDLRAG